MVKAQPGTLFRGRFVTSHRLQRYDLLARTIRVFSSVDCFFTLVGPVVLNPLSTAFP